MSFDGPAFLSEGFRPFFLAALAFAVAVVPLWWMIWNGYWTLNSPFPPMDWHIHEMIFGYTAAVIAGFLFTAVPNWSGRSPTRGWQLLGLSALWLVGRIALFGAFPLGAISIAVIDCAFLLAIAAKVTYEIAASRNWRNLKVVVPLGLLSAANILYHIEVMATGEAAIGRRLGLATVLFLITFIGGRIIPSFTRNWLLKQGATKLPVPFGRLDAAIVGFGAFALLMWVARPEWAFTGALLVVSGLMHFVRVSRWQAGAVWRAPLLLMLHISYVFLAAGLIMTGAASLGLAGAAAGLHLLGIGAIGGMTIAVMLRATLGHTGRALVAGRALTLAFALICAAAIMRAALPGITVASLDGITITALLWTLGFAILAVVLVPWLALPALARKTPT